MFSGLLLLAAVALISWEAINRFFEPSEPLGRTIMVVAAIGVVINSVTAWFFISGKDHDLNTFQIERGDGERSCMQSGNCAE